eukprot:6300473-Alexandrium_andersonii.AAC.1
MSATSLPHRPTLIFSLVWVSVAACTSDLMGGGVTRKSRGARTVSPSSGRSCSHAPATGAH